MPDDRLAIRVRRYRVRFYYTDGLGVGHEEARYIHAYDAEDAVTQARVGMRGYSAKGHVTSVEPWPADDADDQ